MGCSNGRSMEAVENGRTTTRIRDPVDFCINNLTGQQGNRMELKDDLDGKSRHIGKIWGGGCRAYRPKIYTVVFDGKVGQDFPLNFGAKTY